MILFDADAIYILHWGTTNERNFIRAIIDENKVHKNIGITEFTKGEVYRVFLDSLVCVYNIFLKKCKENNSLGKQDIESIFEISSDMLRALLPGRRERRKARIKGIIRDVIFDLFKEEIIRENERSPYRNPLKTVLIRLYNYITNFDEIFLDESIYFHKESRIDCQWASYEIESVPLDYNSLFPIVGWGCSRFHCGKSQTIENWVNSEIKRIKSFIDDYKSEKIDISASWIKSLILVWKKLFENYTGNPHIYNLCRNIGDFILILDAEKDDSILSSNEIDFRDACTYFNIEFLKIERDILKWE